MITIADLVTYIYTLNDPDTGDVRYVGQTDYPSYRLAQHMNPSARDKKTAKSKWVLSLVLVGKRPVMHIIDSVREKYKNAAEEYWINYFAHSGSNITNCVHAILTDYAPMNPCNIIVDASNSDAFSAKHLTVLLRESKAEEFRIYCASIGISVSEYIRNYILSCVMDVQTGIPDSTAVVPSMPDNSDLFQQAQSLKSVIAEKRRMVNSHGR